MRMQLWGASLLALAPLVVVQNSSAQQATAQTPVQVSQSAADAEEIIVTGTRVKGTTAAESAAPIQVVGSDDLATVGQPNLTKELSRLVPSFSSPNFGGDTANLTTAAVLRGLSPNHVLVLVNGKRRHASANLSADSGPDQGSNAVDLDLIPASAIDHIEVLTDGAAAQYGSDAIAGVINIILKNSDHGGSVSTTSGAYYGNPFHEVHEEGQGFTIDGSGDVGVKLGDGGFLRLSTEYRHHDNSNLSGPDLRGAASGIPSNPYQSRLIGDPESTLETVTYNAGETYDGIEFYSFGTYGHRHAKSWENYRTETKLPAIYPLGFEPAETLEENDYSVTVGAKSAFGPWLWDISTTYGGDQDNIGVVDSANVPLYRATGYTPTVYHAGNFLNSEWTSNIDISRPVEIGLSAPLNIAFGTEYRYETFELDAGDPASRYSSGSQAFPGFQTTDASNVNRDSVGTYIDLAAHLTPEWQVDAAGRFENFSDFGSTSTGKLSTRYDFNPQLGLRATVSNGFRAPSLAQEYFSATNVSPTEDVAQLPANSPAAKLLGATNLQPEASTNISFGVVAQPVPHLQVTADAYQIQIDKRIIDTGLLGGPQALAAIAANGNTIEPGTVAFAQYFTNGVDTRTRGFEFSANYPQDFGEFGEIDWNLGLNLNQTSITKIDIARSLIGPDTISYLTTATPHSKIILGAHYTKDAWDVTLRETRYGNSATVNQNLFGTAYYTDDITPKYITDLEIGYRLDRLHLAVGANNLFNVFPNTVASIREIPIDATVYNNNSPFGANGGYYYARVSYSFGG